MNNFEVGDEVVYKNQATQFVVTSIEKNGFISGIGKDGIAFCSKNSENWQKTGKHYVEAELLMKALNEAE